MRNSVPVPWIDRIREAWKLHDLTPWRLLRRVGRAAVDDEILRRAPELAFYLVLAIFPFLFFISASLGYLLEGSRLLEAAIYDSLRRFGPGSDVAEMVGGILDEIRGGKSGQALALGLIGALWVASMGMQALIQGLNAAFEVRETRPWWKQRLLAILLTAILTILVSAGTAGLLFGEVASQVFAGPLSRHPSLGVTTAVLRWLLGLLAALLALDLLYNFGPPIAERRRRWLTPGATAALALWLSASWGFRWYLASFPAWGRLYGSLGTVMVLLLWCFLTAGALLLGAEVNSELSKAARASSARHDAPDLGDDEADREAETQR